MADDDGESQSLPVTSKILYREDVIRHATRRDKIGIVLVNGKDSDSSSDSEDDEEKVEDGHVLVSWYPKGHEEEIEENMLEVVDRSLQHGDIVRWADPSKGGMKGTVTKINVKVNIRVIGARHLQVKDIDCNELDPIQKFYQGLSIVLQSWIGVVNEVLFKLTLKLKNGARCIVEGEQANMLVDNTDQREEDSTFYCELFYPGQSVAGPSRLFRDAHWINGPRPVFTGNQRVCCVIEEIAVSGLHVRWHERVYNATENGIAEPSSILTKQDIEHVSAFGHFNQESIQIGDKAFYILKESDVDNPAKRYSNEQSSNLKEQPDQKKSRQTAKCKEASVDDIDDDKLDDNDSTCTEESADDEDSDHGNVREGRQSTVGTSGSRRNESRHQGAASANRGHAARKRRQNRRKKKRYQVPVRLIPGERVCVEVDSTSKLLTVLWQDGSVQENVPSTDVLPVLHVDELEFFPGEFVIDKTAPTHTAAYGVVQKSDHTERTCNVKWMDRDEKESDSQVSVYDIGPHPNYTFKMADIVVRLIDVAGSEIDERANNVQESPSCGEVLQVDNDGGVHVLWTDGATSVMQPQNLFVVDTEDWSSEAINSSSDEEWETASDVSTDQENLLEDFMQPLDRNILDDIARRSVAALGNNAPGSPEDFNEERIVRNNIPAEEESGNTDPFEGNADATVSNSGSVRVRPDPNQSTDSERCTFSVMEEVPTSHKFATQPFQPANQRQFNSAIRKEIAGLRSHLPSGVLVKGFESRLDLYSILIEGPAGTPYEDGVFIFDVQLPPNYPKSPPVVRYLSQCTERLNPNLYEDGTVCVSLLGTWSGKGSETWTSKSNLCQLILSLQGLILVEEPYFNEAGYEKHKGSAEGAENSRMYNELVLIKMLQSLERLWKTPPETFREEIKQHLNEHLPKLFSRIYNWLGLYASSEFLQKHNIQKVMDENSVAKPDFPLLPLSVGFCISLLRNLKNLERTFNNAARGTP